MSIETIFLICGLIAVGFFIAGIIGFRKERIEFLHYIRESLKDKRKTVRIINKSSVRAFLYYQKEMLDCWVTDRSTDGLAILLAELPNKLKVGDVLNIKTTKSPISMRVEVEVRNIFDETNGCKIGCRFLNPLDDEFIKYFSG